MINLRNDSDDPGHLATYFANIVCSKWNQHVIIMILGAAGHGKSYAGLNLATEISKEIARLLGGNPEDYFNFKEDFATINKDEVMRVMDNPKKHHVLLIDDAAVSWSSRKSFDKYNIDMNDLIQTFRPNNNVVILTLQDDFLIDKVPRNLAHYQIHMEQAYFSLGITTAKVFKNVMKHRGKEPFTEYLTKDNKKYIRHIFTKPPEEVTKFYEEERSKQLQLLKERKLKAEKEAQTTSASYKAIMNMINSGMTYAKVAEMFEVSKQRIGQIVREHRNDN